MDPYCAKEVKISDKDLLTYNLGEEQSEFTGIRPSWERS